MGDVGCVGAGAATRALRVFESIIVHLGGWCDVPEVHIAFKS